METKKVVKLALLQSELAWGCVTENLLKFEQKIEACQGADLIILPEMFSCGSMLVRRPYEQVLAEKNEVAGRFDEIRQRMLQWSKQVQAVVLGSTVYAAEDLFYNRMIIAFPDGQCQYYDKRHCFRMGGENEHFSSGGRRVVFDYAGAKIAVFICYDLRFPVWCRNVDGYDIAVYIANWPAARREVWQMLLKARAIENQAYVAGVNCVGTDLNGIVYAGDSMGVNARGEVMKQAPAFQEATLWLECDRGVLQDFRHKFAVLEDRDSFVVEI